MGGELRKAERLYRAKRYSTLIHQLEPQVFKYRESFQFYFLLGMSCLHTGDIAGAHSYLRRANQLKADDVPTMLALAFISLRRQELPEAIEMWLAVQDLDPRNRIAQRGLNFVKRNPDPGRISELLDSRRTGFLLPPTGALMRAFPRVLVALAAAALLIFVVPLAITRIKESQAPPRVGLAQMNRPASSAVADLSGHYRYILTNAEIRKAFDRMKRDFSQYRDNLARRDINLLVQSNATPVVKEKARLLASYLKAPNFATMKDSFAYLEVAKDPYLYQDCYVDWTGRVSNLVVTRKAITFDFLVGYHDERVLQGIVPVTLNFAADINPTYPLEILGKIELKGTRITLAGVSIHQLGPSTPQSPEVGPPIGGS